MEKKESKDGKIKIGGNVISRAKQNEREALEDIFSLFVLKDEKIIFSEYFGTLGVVLLTNSFGCVTSKRVIALEVGPFDQIHYKDLFISEIKSIEINQSNILRLVLGTLIYIIFTFGIGILFFNRFIKTYYRLNKIGISYTGSKEVEINIFANKSKISKLNKMQMIVVKQKESFIQNN